MISEISGVKKGILINLHKTKITIQLGKKPKIRKSIDFFSGYSRI